MHSPYFEVNMNKKIFHYHCRGDLKDLLSKKIAGYYKHWHDYKYIAIHRDYCIVEFDNNDVVIIDKIESTVGLDVWNS